MESRLIVSLLVLLAGPLSGLWLQRRFTAGSQKLMPYTVVFSGSFLLGISIFGLMPELFEHLDQLQAGIWILIGFFLQIVLEKFTGGLGHGHIHSHDVPRSVFVLFGGLMLHALFEGFSAGQSKAVGEGLISGMVVGISVHEIPAAFSLSVLMYSVYKGKVHTSLFLIIYACATPLGFLLGNYSNNFISESVSGVLTALIAGTFLHISTTIVFENSLRKREGIGKWAMILAGLVISFLACALDH